MQKNISLSLQLTMRNMLPQKTRYTDIIFSLLFVFLFSSCASSTSSKKFYPASNPPQYLKNSGILKLERKLSIPFGDGASKMFFSHTGKYLVTTGSKSAHTTLWDMDTGKIIHRWDVYRPDKNGRHRRPLRFGKFSRDIVSRGSVFYPDDSKLLLRRGKRKEDTVNFSFYLVDLKNPAKLVASPPLNESLTGGEFSPDGKYYATPGRSSINTHPWYGIDPFLKLYRTSDWKVIADVKKGHAPHVIKFTPDGKYVVDYASMNQVASPYTPEGWAALSPEEAKKFFPLLRFWSVPDLKLVKTIDPESGTASLPKMAISPDGCFIAVTVFVPTTKVFSLTSGELLFEFESQAGLDFTSDSKYLLAVKRHSFEKIKVFSTEDWQLKEQVNFKRSYWAIGRAFNTQRNLLAISDGPVIYIWKVVGK